MKEKRTLLTTQFEPETRFDVPPAPFRGTRETELDRLRDSLVRDLLTEVDHPELNSRLRRAANDAAALAWATAFPLLVFPELLREKARAARRQHSKQAALSRRCAPTVGQAA